jgi:hypothetical protein
MVVQCSWRGALSRRRMRFVRRMPPHVRQAYLALEQALTNTRLFETFSAAPATPPAHPAESPREMSLVVFPSLLADDNRLG